MVKTWHHSRKNWDLKQLKVTNKRFFTAFGRQFQHSKQKFQVLGLYAPCLHGHSGLSGDRNSALKRHTQMKHLAMHYMVPVDKTEMIFRCFLMMNKNDFPRFHLDLEHGVTSTCFFSHLDSFTTIVTFAFGVERYRNGLVSTTTAVTADWRRLSASNRRRARSLSAPRRP